MTPLPIERSKKAVFLIEDDSDIRSSIVDVFTEEGIELDCAGNGEEALKKLRTKEDKPSLILLDLRLPIKDGFQFREEQRKDPELAQIPVVVISADGRIDDKTSKMGADKLLRKPIDIEDLLGTVQRYLH